jgi:hypothetical protein
MGADGNFVDLGCFISIIRSFAKYRKYRNLTEIFTVNVEKKEMFSL